MGIKVVAGRDFTADDRQDTASVVIVNRAFVRRYLATRNPLQVQFAFGYPTVDPKAMRTIVGVVDDVKYKSLSEDAEPAYYVAQAQIPYLQQAVVVETQLPDPRALIPAIRAELQRLDPQLAVDFEPASEIVAATLTRQQLGMALMLLFGLTAVTLAAVGIYGVITYVSAQRAGEVATRLALGATPVDVFWLMMRRGLRLAAAGAAVGLAAAYVTGRAVTSIVYGITASNPTVLITAMSIVVLVTSIATAIPARAAARIDPIRALRGG